MQKLIAACVQMRTSDVVEENVRDASEMIAEAARRGATLIVTPEMTSLLDRRPGALFEKAKTEDKDTALPAFQRLASDLSVNLIIGSLPIKIGDTRCVNRSYLIARNGSIVARYDKIHMFDVQLGEGQVYRESERYQAGNHLELASVDDFKVGLTVCYDLRFPELYRNLARAGADILTIPSAFTKITGEAHWHILLRARAIETGCFVLAPAQGGLHADGRETYGHSLIIDPWGKVIAEGATDPGVILGELDLKLVAEVRQKIPSLQHDRPYTINESKKAS